MYFQLYAHNVPVRGQATSAIYDLQHGAITRIPNVLVDLLAQLAAAPLATVRQRYAHDADSFDRYLAFLLEKGLGFYSDEPARFPATNFNWQYPGLLTHAVLEHDFRHYSLPDALTQLDALLCRHLELQLDVTGQPPGCLGQLLAPLALSGFKTIALFVRHTADTTLELLEELFAAHPKLTYVFCHSAPATCQSTRYPQVVLTRWQLGAAPAALPTPRYVVNYQFFAEAQRHNPYYNGKVCVSRRGEVKNCLSHARHFGPVADLSRIVGQADFQELWYACADKIDGLRDSALRYATCLSSNLRRKEDNSYEIVAA